MRAGQIATKGTKGIEVEKECNGATKGLCGAMGVRAREGPVRGEVRSRRGNEDAGVESP